MSVGAIAGPRTRSAGFLAEISRGAPNCTGTATFVVARAADLVAAPARLRSSQHGIFNALTGVARWFAHAGQKCNRQRSTELEARSVAWRQRRAFHENLPPELSERPAGGES